MIDLAGPGLQIDLTQAETWQEKPPSASLPLEKLPDRFQAIHELASRLSTEQELIRLLESAASETGNLSLNTEGTIYKISRILDKGSSHLAFDHLQELVGLGPGLTPLGDDVILGGLLALNRWKRVINPDLDLVKFNQLLLSIATEKTNKISVSLFNCAVKGSGDERLLVILDSFFSGEEPTIEQMRDLLNWGSSSGVGVLTGIFACVRKFNRN
jgi:hypothetical protein